MSVFKRKRAGKNGKTKPDATWTVEFSDHDGIVRRDAAFPMNPHPSNWNAS